MLFPAKIPEHDRHLSFYNYVIHQKWKRETMPFELWLQIQKGRATESEQAWIMMKRLLQGEKFN